MHYDIFVYNVWNNFCERQCLLRLHQSNLLKYDMLGFALIGVMLSTVSSQDLIGVSYNFDVDYDRIFNNKTCATDESWVLTDYTSLKISSAPSKSNKGIKSNGESCTSSFSVVFFNNSILELFVFLDVFADDSGLKTTVFDENSIPKVTYSYNRRSENFKPGWTSLSIAIDTNITGYINLVGRSRDEEVVLVDSFRYIASNTRNVRLQNNFEIDESDALIENVHEPSELLFDYEGSGEDGEFGSGEEDFDFTHFGADLDEDDVDEKGIIKIEE